MILNADALDGNVNTTNGWWFPIIVTTIVRPSVSADSEIYSRNSDGNFGRSLHDVPAHLLLSIGAASDMR